MCFCLVSVMGTELTSGLVMDRIQLNIVVHFSKKMIV